MKLTNPLLLLAVMALAIGGIAYVSTRGNQQHPVPVTVATTAGEPKVVQVLPDDGLKQYESAATTLRAARARWDDSVKLSQVTPRIQLAGVIQGMQQQAHELDTLTPTLPSCTQGAARHLRASQQASIDLLLAFMGSNVEAIVQSHKADPAPALQAFESTLDGCRPT
jgi:hypothetical protein